MDSDFAVIFDLDGLLVDSERVQAMAFNEALAPHGLQLTDADFAGFVGYSTMQNFRDLAARHAHLSLDVEAIHAAKDRAYERLVPLEMRPMPGALALVASLRDRGVPLAVASSSYRVDVESCLRRVGQRDLRDRVSPGDEVPRTKPWPDVYLRALDLLGMPASRCVALEDAQAGLQAARAAGLRCIAVPNAFTRGHDFRGAERVAGSLEELTVDTLRAVARDGQDAPGPG